MNRGIFETISTGILTSTTLMANSAAFDDAVERARASSGKAASIGCHVLLIDGEPISPQYLNDIERDRRNPPSDFLIERFAKELKIDVARLYYWAKKIPADIAPSKENEARFVTAFKAFRREGKKK